MKFFNYDNAYLIILFLFGSLNFFLFFGTIFNFFVKRKFFYYNSERKNYLTPDYIDYSNSNSNTTSNNSSTHIINNQTESNSSSEQINEDKEVFIIRGLPGSGKKLLALSMEYKKYRPFSICYYNDFFYKYDGNYVYNRNDMDRALLYSYNKFINSISDNINTIYVLGVFENPYQYQNYIDLAEANGYKVNIIEIFCPNEDYLFYFNKRSVHNIPMKVSLRLYDNWVFDKSSIIQEPFLEDFDGDCLPSYNKPSIEQLDKELDDYINGHTQYIYQSRYNWEFISTDHQVRLLTQKTVNKISSFEIIQLLINYIDYKRSSNSSNYDSRYVRTMKQFNDSAILQNMFYNIIKNDSYFH
jgi:hypothetical protein